MIKQFQTDAITQIPREAYKTDTNEILNYMYAVAFDILNFVDENPTFLPESLLTFGDVNGILCKAGLISKVIILVSYETIKRINDFCGANNKNFFDCVEKIYPTFKNNDLKNKYDDIIKQTKNTVNAPIYYPIMLQEIQNFQNCVVENDKFKEKLINKKLPAVLSSIFDIIRNNHVQKKYTFNYELEKLIFTNNDIIFLGNTYNRNLFDLVRISKFSDEFNETILLKTNREQYFDENEFYEACDFFFMLILFHKINYFRNDEYLITERDLLEFKKSYSILRLDESDTNNLLFKPIYFKFVAIHFIHHVKNPIKEKSEPVTNCIVDLLDKFCNKSLFGNEEPLPLEYNILRKNYCCYLPEHMEINHQRIMGINDRNEYKDEMNKFIDEFIKFVKPSIEAYEANNNNNYVNPLSDKRDHSINNPHHITTNAPKTAAEGAVAATKPENVK
jgi:hypothetical protein